MLLRIFSILFLIMGNLGFVFEPSSDGSDSFYTHIAISFGLVCLGVGGLTMSVRQYRGGAATVIGGLLSFFALTGIVQMIESYIYYQEYNSSALTLNVALIIMAVCLFLQGYKGHRMQLVLRAKNIIK
ncbi:MAG: putative membrane protein [Oleiphilaceae bacterium]|jgi:uncharacterized membrane protein